MNPLTHSLKEPAWYQPLSHEVENWFQQAFAFKCNLYRYGSVRYMNYAGCKRKFKIAEYVERIEREVMEEKVARYAAATTAAAAGLAS